MQQRHDDHRFSFASDNLAGTHPEIMQALAAVGGGHVDAYGEDPYTRAFGTLAEDLFGGGTQAFPVLNGTGANVLALAAATPRWGAVVTPETSHLVSDEAGAPEHTAGLKLITCAAPDGKLTPAQIHAAAAELGNPHHAQPTTVSIANVTELGTVYTPEQIAALAEAAHDHRMLLHLDGSRLANAAAALGADFKSLTTDVGVDILSLGATKNGAMLAEAVVVLPGGQNTLAQAVQMLRKGHLQLVSKARYIAAQLLAMFQNDLWQRNAEHANRMAARLAAGLERAGETPVQAVQANLVFTTLPLSAVDALRERFDFHGEGTAASPARLVCAFDTPAETVDAFIAAVAHAKAHAPA